MNAIPQINALAPAARIRAVVVDGPLDQDTIRMLREAIDSPDATVVFAPPRVSEIVEEVSRVTDVPISVILGPSKVPAAVKPRFAACWVAFHFGRAPTAIGRSLQHRGWATIRNAIAKANALRDRDADFKALTENLVAHFEKGGLA